MARNNKNYIARLKEENEDLKRDLSRAEKMLELLTDTTGHMTEKMMAENERLEELIEHFKKAVHKMVYRNAELRRKLKEQKPVSGVDYAKHCKLIAVCGKQKEEIGYLNKEIAKLKDDLRIEKDGRKGLFEQNKQLKAKNEALSQDFKDLIEISKKRGKRIEELKSENESLTEKVKDLEAKTIEDQQELVIAHMSIDNLKATVKDLDDKIRILAEGLKNDFYNKLLNGDDVPKEFIKAIANVDQKKPDCDGKTGKQYT